MTSKRQLIAALISATLGLAAACGSKQASTEPEADKTAGETNKEAAPMAHTLDPQLREKLFQAPVSTLDGQPSSLAAHQGKALLVVNVASKCGLTPQYADLEKLHKEYAAKGFSVVGFPCNQFGGQEPGTAEEIKTFCSTTYGVTFPMFEKIEVNGGARHPVYEVLTSIPDTKGEAGDVQWNFEKFLISADGSKITRFRPRTEPYDPALVAAIQAALPQN